MNKDGQNRARKYRKAGTKMDIKRKIVSILSEIYQAFIHASSYDAYTLKLSDIRKEKNMGIELGGIGVALSSAGLAVGRAAFLVGRGLEGGRFCGAVAGPHIGSVNGVGFLGETSASAFGATNTLASFGPKLEIPTPSLINEGPVSFGALENSVVYTPRAFDLVGDLRVNLSHDLDAIEQPNFTLNQKTITQASFVPKVEKPAIVEKDFILSAAKTPLEEQSVVAEAEHWLNIKSEIQSEPLSKTAVLLEAENILQVAKKTVELPLPKLPKPFIPAEIPIEIPLIYPDVVKLNERKRALEMATLHQLSKKVTLDNQAGTATKSLSRQTLVTVAPEAKEQPVAQRLEQRVEIAEEAEQVLDTQGEKETVEELRATYLEDEEVSEQRRVDIDLAIKLAKVEAEAAGITEIEGWRIAKFLPEHAAVRSQVVKKTGPDGSFEETVEEIAARKFANEKEAKKVAKNIVAVKQPVKLGQYGRLVTLAAVTRVFKRRIAKNYFAQEVVLARITKKQRVQAIQNQHQHLTSIVPLKKAEDRIEPMIEEYGKEWTEVFQLKAA